MFLLAFCLQCGRTDDSSPKIQEVAHASSIVASASTSESTPCLPRSDCADGECSLVDDGCGGLLDCGLCQVRVVVTPRCEVDDASAARVEMRVENAVYPADVSFFRLSDSSLLDTTTVSGPADVVTLIQGLTSDDSGRYEIDVSGQRRVIIDVEYLLEQVFCGGACTEDCEPAHGEIELWNGGGITCYSEPYRDQAPVASAALRQASFDGGAANKPVLFGVQTSTNWTALTRGLFRVERSGIHDFRLALHAGDNANLWLGGQEVIPFRYGCRGEQEASVELSAGDYPLHLKFWDDGWPDAMTLSVRAPGSQEFVVVDLDPSAGPSDGGDDDNDGVPNSTDPCPQIAYETQCAGDSDDDGIADGDEPAAARFDPNIAGPGTPELCDGKDNNGNGLVDEGTGCNPCD